MGKEAVGEGQHQQQRPPDGAGGGGGGRGGRGGGGGRGGSGRLGWWWCCCCGVGGVVRLKCVAALVLGVAVLLSAVFWLPPFARRGRGSEGPDPGAGFDADIVASFRLHKMVPELNGNASKLELDIYEEIGIPNSTVVVNSLQLVGSNWTNVIFSIVPYPKNLTLSSTGLSILRSYFMSFVVRQSTLQLTESLFGNSSSFEVLKFPGGITIIPPQTAFLPQKPHATFNFTLNFPIYKVQDRIDELKDQMKTGLLLNSYENLYIKLANLNGSTVDPPTIVETSIFLEVGNHQPSVPRMKQLAQTITNSSSGNLGLNHTVFGRVKQISLSSYLRHSLHSGGGSEAPSPAPMHHHGHHHHHHHHHGHEDSRHSAPAQAPVHYPVHEPRYGAPPPSRCPYGTDKPKNKAHVMPAPEPTANGHHFASPVALPPHSLSPRNPNVHSRSPIPSPPVLPEPPLPTVSFAHAHPPSEHTSRRDPAGLSALAPAPHSSNATRSLWRSIHWANIVPLVCILMSLL
ncbi:hydroxyproline-rich glycoprotein-like [Oryza sativa Japonica Group]|uniref:Hydroxyproline-rich glycoprotein-like n=2 Tax=Oryza sativa subsp. japonica TaxID=39947 RepID=Q0JG72_ORYSJ|nr:uncharacterized protein LOC4326504 [Oryza sativa Japonica Group]KAB8085132.1 hypothetical protein EE612_007874 [Oryza sativa]EEE55974.1 hypothetical protein OsJ_04708 [Oryza sativa Japonica Group]KAF2954229.1 hypothetical protein DAI22_01g465500 [Oryza sativa Japonica Group]BAD87313.1 hydroxyproline-rich glycoprotein-like [Oryza sativa Japonica Group]BAD87605.1 hydroxyproline-rich glycoprotein-like [Oryza sativa Japonica Group]|eukprot:NP_001045342.1 Os01g0938600 [Oryza sativa Japonica Group]